MRRVLPPAEFARWLAALPARPAARTARSGWLAPGIVTDPTDPKLAHLDGLNLSRAWMLEGIAARAARGRPRASPALRAAAARPPRGGPRRRHRRALRGRPLARDVRRLPGDRPRPPLRRTAPGRPRGASTSARRLIRRPGSSRASIAARCGPRPPPLLEALHEEGVALLPDRDPRLGLPRPGALGAAEGPAIPTLAIGATAPDFDLPGVDGKRYTLASFAKAKVLVLVFTANHCPTAQAYEERIEKLHADFEGRGVQVVLVSPNDPLALRLDEQGYSDLGDTLEDMKLRAKDRGLDVPLPLRRRDAGDVAEVRAGGDAPRLRLRRGAEAALRRPRGRQREPGEGHDARRPRRDRGGARGQAGPGRDDQGLRLLGQVVGQAGLGEGGLREVGPGAGRPSRRSTRPGSRPRRRTRAARSSA